MAIHQHIIKFQFLPRSQLVHYHYLNRRTLHVCLSLCPSISIETTCGATAERLHFRAKQQRVTAVGQSQMHSKGDGKSAFRNQSTTTTKDMLICTPDYSAAGPVKIRRRWSRVAEESDSALEFRTHCVRSVAS